MNNAKLENLFKENGTDNPAEAIFMLMSRSGDILFWDGVYSYGDRTEDHRGLLNYFIEDDNDTFDYDNIFENYNILEIRPEYNEIFGDIEEEYYNFEDVISEYFEGFELVDYKG